MENKFTVVTDYTLDAGGEPVLDEDLGVHEWFLSDHKQISEEALNQFAEALKVIGWWVVVLDTRSDQFMWGLTGMGSS